MLSPLQRILDVVHSKRIGKGDFSVTLASADSCVIGVAAWSPFNSKCQENGWVWERWLGRPFLLSAAGIHQWCPHPPSPAFEVARAGQGEETGNSEVSSQ